MSATADDFINFTRSPADHSAAAVTNKTVPSAPSRDLDYYTWVYMSPFVFLPGVVGNILTAVVMHRPAFRRTTTAIYLPLIAIADTIVLVSGLLPEWLEWIDVVVLKELSIWTCRAHKFVFFTAGDVSIWLIIAFTFDRFIAVCFPLSKRTVCAPKRAVIASVVIFLVFCAKNAHEFWTRGYVPSVNETAAAKTICGIPQPYSDFHTYIRPWIAFTMITALPFVLILIFNVLIVHSLIRAQRMRALHAAAGHGGNAAGGSSAASAASGFRQTTLMCLSVSFAFLACILPSIILLIGKPHWSVSPPATAATKLAYKRAKAINNMLVYVNHSINFILYCLTGRRFRDELSAMFQTAKKKPGAAGTKTSGLTSTTNTNGNGNKRRLGPEVSGTSKGTTLTTEVDRSEMAVKPANGEPDADSFVD